MAATPLLRLGTRRSPLAMAQAEEARARLCAAHGWQPEAVELVPVTASGKRPPERPTNEAPMRRSGAMMRSIGRPTRE